MSARFPKIPGASADASTEARSHVIPGIDDCEGDEHA